MDLPFTIVDVFTERRYAGNPLAVVRNAAALPHDEMLSIARETNFSETTFVVDDQPTVRIFTPREEIPFAGHPTLGTAAVLMGDAKEITLRLKVGPIRVWREGPLYWMRQNAPTFGPAHDAGELAAMLGLRADDVAGPVETVSTGLPHVVVPLRSLDALRRASLDRPRYQKFVSAGGANLLYAFAAGADDPRCDVTARQLEAYHGFAEDPATGSAAGCLAAYLSRHRALGSDAVEARVSQGANVGRPSVLHLRAQGAKVEVGGGVARVVEGTLVR